MAYGGGRGRSSAIGIKGERDRLLRCRECLGEPERDRDLEWDRGCSSEYVRLYKRTYYYNVVVAVVYLGGDREWLLDCTGLEREPLREREL